MARGDGGGRPLKTLTPEQVCEVETLAAFFTQDQIADYFGMSRPTFAAIMERKPEVFLHYKRGRAKAVGAVAKSLFQKAREGDTACMIFFLKTQAGWKETTTTEVTGANGQPIAVAAVSKSEYLAAREGVLDDY